MKSPLVLNITNSVTAEFCADALLAVGASPLMSSSVEEMEDVVPLCDSLVINIGTVNAAQRELMMAAAGIASAKGIPWVLDPAGVGAGSFRFETVSALLEMHPSIVRGNPSEIISIATNTRSGRGVDATDEAAAAMESAVSLSLGTGAVVSVSGLEDIVASGNVVERVAGGSSEMRRVTGMGCVSSSLAGAFLAMEKDSFRAALRSAEVMKSAGGRAALNCSGSGSFRVAFLDELCRI